MKSALASTPSIASRMRGSSGSYCAFTSTSGIGRTPGKSRDEIEQAEGDSGDHEVIEVFADAVVVRPDRPADRGKAEAEDSAADRREAEEAEERHPADPRRDRDERADARRHKPRGHRHATKAVEPALGSVEPLARDMEESPMPLEPHFCVASDRPTAGGPDHVPERPGERHHDIGSAVRLDLVAEEDDLRIGKCAR